MFCAQYSALQVKLESTMSDFFDLQYSSSQIGFHLRFVIEQVTLAKVFNRFYSLAFSNWNII